MLTRTDGSFDKLTWDERAARNDTAPSLLLPPLLPAICTDLDTWRAEALAKPGAPSESDRSIDGSAQIAYACDPIRPAVLVVCDSAAEAGVIEPDQDGTYRLVPPGA